MESGRSYLRRAISVLLAVLFLTAVYVFAWPSPNVPYFGAVVVHLLAGVLFLVALAIALRGMLREGSLLTNAAWILLLAGGIVGAVLIYTGTPHSRWNILWAHIAACVAGGALLGAAWARKRGWTGGGSATRSAIAAVICLAAAGALTAGVWWVRTAPWERTNRIENPAIAPASMEGEGAGPTSPFFPSSGETATGKTVTQNFFLDSQACQRCHADIYQQWESSMHHFSSFNNQWYRQAIVYMQGTIGVQSSKWCAGCH
ncbi:MAG: multiheme c-type cytochrome, partial [Candidatus Acidiferrales bacterium]